jgi:hypothetical protein
MRGQYVTSSAHVFGVEMERFGDREKDVALKRGRRPELTIGAKDIYQVCSSPMNPSK